LKERLSSAGNCIGGRNVWVSCVHTARPVCVCVCVCVCVFANKHKYVRIWCDVCVHRYEFWICSCLSPLHISLCLWLLVTVCDVICFSHSHQMAALFAIQALSCRADYHGPHSLFSLRQARGVCSWACACGGGYVNVCGCVFWDVVSSVWLCMLS